MLCNQTQAEHNCTLNLKHTFMFVYLNSVLVDIHGILTVLGTDQVILWTRLLCPMQVANLSAWKH